MLNYSGHNMTQTNTNKSAALAQPKPVQPTHGLTPKPFEGTSPVTPVAYPEKFLRLPAVCELTTLGKSSIYTIPDFPRPVLLNQRGVAWKLSEVAQWLESRPSVEKGVNHAAR
jgi:predicted DNA-binding transcriptional regulator AlpA